MTEEVVTISDSYRVPIQASKRGDGGVLIRCPKSWILLSKTELDRLVAFARNGPTIQRFVASTKSTEIDQIA
jgi:hypothetical protein